MKTEINKEAEYNHSEDLSLIDHLKELKKRVLISVASIVIFSSLAFLFVEEIYQFLAAPLAELVGNEDGRRMIFTGLHEAFFTYLKLALFAGFICSFPIFRKNQIFRKRENVMYV